MDHLVGHIEPFVREHGAVAVGLILFLESLGLPLPGESMLVVAGVVAGKGEMSLPGLLLASWLGSVAGDNVGYLVGHRLGRGLLLRYGGRVGLTEERYRRVERVFARYGPPAVAFARFVNLLRQLNGLAAGAVGMEWRVFLLFNALGAALWVTAWGFGAYLFGHHVMSVASLTHRLGPWGLAGLAALGLGAIAVILLLARRFRPVADRAG